MEDSRIATRENANISKQTPLEIIESREVICEVRIFGQTAWEPEAAFFFVVRRNEPISEVRGPPLRFECSATLGGIPAELLIRKSKRLVIEPDRMSRFGS
jgi:hypothetical protein